MQKAAVRSAAGGQTLAELTSSKRRGSQAGLTLTGLSQATMSQISDIADTSQSRSGLDIVDSRVQHQIERKSQEETEKLAKEELLEQIMAMSAYSGFEQVGRYQLKKHITVRSAINADKIRRPEPLPGPLGTEDLEDEVLDSDDEFVATCGLERCSTNEPSGVPAVLANTLPGVTLGFGRVKKAQEQDHLFAARCGDRLLVGVINGHGRSRISSELTRLVATEMPRAVFRSSALMSNPPDPARALNDAFCRMHRRVSSELDAQLAGAVVTVALVDSETIMVAHVGDCRAVLGVPDHRPSAEEFHFNPVALTQDHNASVKHEFDRIQKCGGETRKLMHDNVYRIYIKDGEVPGLTVSRAIGDRIGHLAGVCHFPSITAVRREDLTDGSFLLLGSGGLWAMMSERAAVNWVSRHHSSPGEAAQSLSVEAARRWQDSAHPAKTSLHPTIRNCFGVAALFLGSAQQDRALDEASNQTPRQFVLTHESRPNKWASWSQVKSKDRSTSLRRMQANGRDLHEDNAWAQQGQWSGTC